MSSSAMRSSSDRSLASPTISVRRGSEKSRCTSRSSSLITPSSSCSLLRMASRRVMSFCTSASSSRIFCFSMPVRRWSCISRMALAWISESPYSVCSWAPAISRFALARLAQIVARPPGDHVAPVRDEALEQRLHAQRARLPAVDGQHGGAEAVLEEGAVLVEVVQHYAGDRVALGLHHRPDALAARLVAQVADPLEPLLLHELGDALDRARLVDLVGHLGHHDGVAAGLLVGLDVHLGAHAP